MHSHTPQHIDMATPTPQEAGLRFKDKVVVVTGGCNGIGKACVDLFLENGAKVAVLDIDEQTGSKLASENPEVLFFVKCDVSKEDQVKKSAESVVDKFGKIDTLINNAGIITVSGAIDDTTLEDFHKIIGINLLGYFLVSKHTLPHLRKTKGSIVNMASVAGQSGYQGTLTYSVTKGGILAFTKTLAVDEARNGVRVNSVSPGMVWTPMAAEYHKMINDQTVLENMKNYSLLKRFGEPREIAQACFFLACEGTYCTGSDISVNAGSDVGLGIRTVHI